MKIVFVAGCLLAIIPVTSWAQQISCGDRPKIERAVEDKIKGDVEGKARILTQRIASGEFKAAVESSKTALYQDHQDVGRDEMDQYFAWIVCQAISLDSSLSTSDKIEKWMTAYKTITSRGISAAPAMPPPPPGSYVFFANGIKFSVKRLVPPRGNSVALLLTITNINDSPTKLMLLQPWPNLSDADGNTLDFDHSVGLQYCRSEDPKWCAGLGNFLVEFQPNLPTNVVLYFSHSDNSYKPSSASFSARILVTISNSQSDVSTSSVAIADIPFK